jgi:hypothetical protein
MADINIPNIGAQASLYPFKLEDAPILLQRLDGQNSFWIFELIAPPPLLFPMLGNTSSLFFTRLKEGVSTSGISIPTLQSSDNQQLKFTIGRAHGIFF